MSISKKLKTDKSEVQTKPRLNLDISNVKTDPDISEIDTDIPNEITMEEDAVLGPNQEKQTAKEKIWAKWRLHTLQFLTIPLEKKQCAKDRRDVDKTKEERAEEEWRKIQTERAKARPKRGLFAVRKSRHDTMVEDILNHQDPRPNKQRRASESIINKPVIKCNRSNSLDQIQAREERVRMAAVTAAGKPVWSTHPVVKDVPYEMYSLWTERQDWPLTPNWTYRPERET